MTQHQQQAAKEVIILLIVTLLLFGVILFTLNKFPYLPFSLSVCVWAALVLMYRHKGLVQLSYEKNVQQNTVFPVPALVFVAQVYMITSINFHLISSLYVWLAAILIGFLQFPLFLLCIRREIKSRDTYMFSVSLLLLTFLGNGYLFITITNKALDKVTPVYYETAVTGKETKTLKGGKREYYFWLQGWAEQPKRERVEVPQPLFEKYASPDKVGILYHPGALGIPWFEVIERR
jgi:hypothetical protein